MSRYVSVTLLFAAVAALVGAQGPSGPAPAEQARLVRRNKELLTATVNNSLDLTDKTGALERAGICNKLVHVWAEAVMTAVNDGDTERATEFGRHLNKVADVGVAENLRQARKDIQPDSPSEQVLFRHGEDANRELNRVDAVIGTQSSFQSLRDSLAKSRAHIDDATKSRKK